MPKKIYNPKEAICLSIFAEPKNVENIKIELYGNRNSKVPKWINELSRNKKIKRKLARDGRYHIYQTNPKTLLDYILKIGKEKSICFTNEEKTKLLTYFKDLEFQQYVREYTEYVSNPKDVLYSFYGLIDYMSINSIYIFYVAKFIEKIEKITPNIGMSQLGLPLLVKIGKLTDRAALISSHYKKYLELINTAYEIQINSLKKNK